MKNSFKASIVFCSILSVIFLVSCSSNDLETGSNVRSANGSSAQDMEFDGESAELVIHGGGITDILYEKVIEPAISQKYPNINLTLVRGNLEELFSSGVKPDIISGAGIALTDMVRLDIPTDLSSMIKQFNMDLTRIEPAIIQEMEEIGGTLEEEGAILGLPFWMNYGATIYNKDIFDKFGYDYPLDTLTWEDMLDYTKKITRSDDGIQFVGGSIWNAVNMFKQYGAPYVDANDEPLLTTDEHRHVVGLIQEFFNVPNYINDQTYIQTGFFREANVALYPGWLALMVNSMTDTEPAFAWDLTSFPTYKERPNQGAPVDYLVLMVSKTTDHQDAAFHVIHELLTDEVQAKVNQVGSWITILKDTKIKQSYAKEVNLFEGKNLEAVFKVAPTPNPPYTENRIEVAQAMNNLVEKMALEQIDINTALREGEEEAAQLIRSKAQ